VCGGWASGRRISTVSVVRHDASLRCGRRPRSLVDHISVIGAFTYHRTMTACAGSDSADRALSRVINSLGQRRPPSPDGLWTSYPVCMSGLRAFDPSGAIFSAKPHWPHPLLRSLTFAPTTMPKLGLMQGYSAIEPTSALRYSDELRLLVGSRWQAGACLLAARSAGFHFDHRFEEVVGVFHQRRLHNSQHV
jgi:hypothetical protein